MEWIEPTLARIASTNVAFYSEESQKVCERICRLLEIDIFPDSDLAHYWRWSRSKNNWHRETIDANQKIDNDIEVFDNRVLGQLQKAPSNILFVQNRCGFTGLVHFTDYGCQDVYTTLYRNFYVFENNLRFALTSSGYSNQDFLDYLLEKKLEEKKKPEKTQNNHFENQLAKYKLPKNVAKMKILLPFQLFELSDLLSFTINLQKRVQSSIRKLSFDGTQTGKISELRNAVMHSKSFTGETEDIPHNLSTFEMFFLQVDIFKKHFNLLQNFRYQQLLPIKEKLLTISFKTINNLKDSELKDLFFKRI